MELSKKRVQFGFQWTATDVRPIKQDDAMREQLRAGYHPAGYGFYDFVCSGSGDLWTATWECQDHCDQLLLTKWVIVYSLL